MGNIKELRNKNLIELSNPYIYLYRNMKIEELSIVEFWSQVKHFLRQCGVFHFLIYADLFDSCIFHPGVHLKAHSHMSVSRSRIYRENAKIIKLNNHWHSRSKYEISEVVGECGANASRMHHECIAGHCECIANGAFELRMKKIYIYFFYQKVQIQTM